MLLLRHGHGLVDFAAGGGVTLHHGPAGRPGKGGDRGRPTGLRIGWSRRPRGRAGFKPAFLRGLGFEVGYPVLSDGDFGEAVSVARQAFQENAPAAVVGYSRGGAAALTLDAGATPLVLIAPSWKLREVPPRAGLRAVILHSAGDDLVPLDDSRELVRACGLPESALVVVGEDHSMIDAVALHALVEAIHAVAGT